MLGPISGLDVLEYGCGAAEWSIALAGEGAKVVALDLSRAQLGHAAKNAARAGVPVSLVCASGEAIRNDIWFSASLAEDGARFSGPFASIQAVRH